MYTLCTQYVHNMYTLCTHYVHTMYTRSLVGVVAIRSLAKQGEHLEHDSEHKRLGTSQPDTLFINKGEIRRLQSLQSPTMQTETIPSLTDEREQR